MTHGNSAPSPAYVYFGGIPHPSIVDGERYRQIGNIVVVPEADLAGFMDTTSPGTLQEFVDRHAHEPASALGKLASLHETAGKPVEITDQATTVIAEARQLIEDLPPDFRVDFPDDGERQQPLRIQKTTDGQLLLGVAPSQISALNTDSKTYMWYALFSPEGLQAGYSDLFAYAFDDAGNVLPDTPEYIDNKEPGVMLSYWTDYLPIITQLVQEHRAGDSAATWQELGKLRAVLSRSRADTNSLMEGLGVPDFMAGLDVEARENLASYGQLPEGVIPQTLPSESILEKLRLYSVDAMTEALQLWGVPYTEVSYSAGTRELNGGTSMLWAILDRQLGVRFNVSTDILPETFTPADTRNHNDLYARILVRNAEDELEEQEVLLYDGCKYRPWINNVQPELPGRLLIPESVRDFLAESGQQEHSLAPRETAYRPTVQTIVSDGSFIKTINTDRFSIREGEVILDNQRLPISPEIVAKLEEVRMVGGGPISRRRQELKVVYRRSGERLFPTIEDASTVQTNEYPPVYKPL